MFRKRDIKFRINQCISTLVSILGHVRQVVQPQKVHPLLNFIRPCQIGILLSVRVRVGLRVLNPIKKQILLLKCSSIISMFRDSEKNITILKLKL